MTKGRFIDVNPSPQNLRAIWDSIHDVRAQLVAAQGIITTQQATIASLQTTLTETDRRARSALASSTTNTGGTTAAPAVPSNGPYIPGPGTSVPAPPNGAPIIDTFGAGDIIPIGSVTWENSNDPSAYTLTAALTMLDWQVNGVHVEHSKQLGVGRWPDQPFGTGSLQYTLWIILNIGGVKYGSGIIQFWYDPTLTLRNGGPPQAFATNWVYSSRWGPMQGYQPAYGENVWLFVTAGDARNNAVSSVLERSQIVQIAFPSNAGGNYTAA